jgi:hypothetical protein
MVGPKKERKSLSTAHTTAHCYRPAALVAARSTTLMTKPKKKGKMGKK